MTVSTPSPASCRDAVVHDAHRICSVLAVDGDLDLLAELLQLVDRGRALEVGGDEAGLRPSFRSNSASFAAAVVLPEPWSPASRITVGGRPVKTSLRAARPHQRRQLVVDDLHDLLARA